MIPWPTYFCLFIFSIWLFRRWGHREVFIRSIQLWSTGLIWPGGAVGLWELRKRVSLSSLLPAQDYQFAHYRCAAAPGRCHCLSHLALQLFIASKVISRISKCRIISPRLRNEGHHGVFNFQQISFLIKWTPGTQQLFTLNCWSVLNI